MTCILITLVSVVGSQKQQEDNKMVQGEDSHRPEGDPWNEHCAFLVQLDGASVLQCQSWAAEGAVPSQQDAPS